MGITNRRIVETDGPDFYPTPAWATYALLENEKFSGEIWEPACGKGHMAEVLRTRNHVITSDLYDRGYGDFAADFLQSNLRADNIVTNPPFNIAEEFVKKCHELATKKFALLLRLAFLESARRYENIYSVIPPYKVLVFSSRITFYPDGAERKGSGTTAYAWFVWDKHLDYEHTIVDWVNPAIKNKYQ